MRFRKTPTWQWFRHDRLRLYAVPAAALSGCLVAWCLAFSSTAPEEDRAFIAQMGALSGAISGLTLSGWFGRPGRSGWALAVLAALLAPVIGGAVAGTLVSPGAGTLVGALLPFLTFTKPLSAAAWVFCLLGMHLGLRAWRARSDPQRIDEKVFD